MNIVGKNIHQQLKLIAYLYQLMYLIIINNFGVVDIVIAQCKVVFIGKILLMYFFYDILKDWPQISSNVPTLLCYIWFIFEDININLYEILTRK